MKVRSRGRHEDFRLAASAICLSAVFALPAHGEAIDTAVGPLEFEARYPAQDTIEKLYDELDFQRFVSLQLYGPEKPYIDKAWVAGDADKLQ